MRRRPGLGTIAYDPIYGCTGRVDIVALFMRLRAFKRRRFRADDEGHVFAQARHLLSTSLPIEPDKREGVC